MYVKKKATKPEKFTPILHRDQPEMGDGTNGSCHIDLDLPVSACTGDECKLKNECRRFVLWETVAKERIGDTCLVPENPCNSFLPKHPEDLAKATYGCANGTDL